MIVSCDTSILVPALLAWHPQYSAAHQLLRARVTAVPDHALLEAYSVMTRLPDPRRPTGAFAAAALTALRRDILDLSVPRRLALLEDLGREGIVGGAVYDALIAATAREHGALLLSADRRARKTYDVLGVPFELVDLTRA